MKILTDVGEVNGITVYWCHICSDWVRGKVLEDYDYPDLCCEDCDKTLVNDWYGYHELESYNVGQEG